MTTCTMDSCGPYSDRLEIVQQLVENGGVCVTLSHSSPCTGDIFFVSDEIHQFNREVSGNTITLDGNVSIIGAGIDWSKESVKLLLITVVVTSLDGEIYYTVGEDYRVNEQGQVTRLTSGQIEDLDIVKVSYMWRQRCIDPMTGFPDATCRSCIDPEQGNLPTGVIFNTQTRLKGLFHIPSNSYDMAKAGVFNLGDGVISFPYDIDVQVSNFTEGGVLCRDKIRIDGIQGVWLVVAVNSIQVGTFLGKRCVIRKIDFAGKRQFFHNQATGDLNFVNTTGEQLDMAIEDKDFINKTGLDWEIYNKDMWELQND